MTTRNPVTNEARNLAQGRSYSTPRLIEYGSLTLLTQSVKVGDMTDPGHNGGGKTKA